MLGSILAQTPSKSESGQYEADLCYCSFLDRKAALGRTIPRIGPIT
jgi:hypothetical protein